jgi:hypothetical protein
MILSGNCHGRVCFDISVQVAMLSLRSAPVVACGNEVFIILDCAIGSRAAIVENQPLARISLS